MATQNTPQARYLNPLTDFGFKKIFGQEDVMIAFLNDLLELKSPITELTFIDKDMSAELESLRGVVYDMFCKTSEGEEFIVEMQNKGQQYFTDRIIYYLSRSISMQEQKRSKEEDIWDYKLKPVYGVFLLNFHLKGFKQRPLRTVAMKVLETEETFSEKIKAFTLELPSFRNKPEDFPKSKIEYWLYNIANMEHMTTPLPFQNEQPIFNKVGTLSELAHMTKEDRLKYDISLDSFRTNYAVMVNEREEGIAYGITIGEERERQLQQKKQEEERIASIQAFRQMGISDEQIAAGLHLPLEYVQQH